MFGHHHRYIHIYIVICLWSPPAADTRVFIGLWLSVFVTPRAFCWLVVKSWQRWQLDKTSQTFVVVTKSAKSSIKVQLLNPCQIAITSHDVLLSPKPSYFHHCVWAFIAQMHHVPVLIWLINLSGKHWHSVTNDAALTVYGNAIPQQWWRQLSAEKHLSLRPGPLAYIIFTGPPHNAL